MKQILVKWKNIIKQKNMNSADRIFRFLLGVLFVLVFIFIDLPVLVSVMVFAAGLLSIASAVFGFCFFYYSLGHYSGNTERGKCSNPNP